MADRFDESLKDLADGAPAGAAEAEAPRTGRAGGDHPSVAALRERFGGAVLHAEVAAGDEQVVYVVPDRIVDVLRWLKEEPDQDYAFLLDVTAVDFGGGRPVQVVYQLWSLTHLRQLRVKAELPLDALEIDSVAPLWATADWLEREVYDLFGIHFAGHPDLRRILMPENYKEGHPLRKDFPLRGRFSRAEQTRQALSMDVEDYYIPEELEMARRREPIVVPESLPGPGTEGVPRGSAAAAAARDDDAGAERRGDTDRGAGRGSAAGGADGPEGDRG